MMSLQSDESGELYSEYRREIQGEPLKRALGRAVIVLMVINSAFVLVDWIVYPEMLRAFLPVRIGLDIVLFTIFVWFRRSHPVTSAFATSFAGGAMLFAVVLGTGGASSDYYVGLVLLFIGIGVLAPLSTVQGAGAIGTLFAVYATIPFLELGGPEVRTSALNLTFLGAAAFVGIMSCAYLDRMRFSDFVQRRDLERASEELKAMDREKSRFTANVHHELRTPLTLMLAPIDMFLSDQFGRPSDEGRRYLASMQKNGFRLLKLINNLLDLAKAEGRQLKIVRRPADLGALITEIVEGARPFALTKQIALSVQCAVPFPTVYVDRDAIEKVLVNLLGNSLKFSSSGGSIEISTRLRGDNEVEIVVSDSGVGLKHDQLERIFDRFAQADSSTTRKFEGTGIGLSLAKELVSLHGGRIWAESDGLGTGTTIRFVLPIGEDDGMEDELSAVSGGQVLGEPVGRIESGESVHTRDLGRLDLRFADLERNSDRTRAVDEQNSAGTVLSGRDTSEILVVDDNADMRELLIGILSQEYGVRCAENGVEGLRLAKEKKPDLILTDVMMPEMSGTELCAAVKNDAGLATVPVVLVTSKADREMRIHGLELGADDYITKPFHPRELLARVHSLVRLNHLQAELQVQNARLESANAELEATLEELKEASSGLVQAERLAAVGELAAGVAHEVNNPVNFATNALRALEQYVSEVQGVASAVSAVNWNEAEAAAEGSKSIERLMADTDFRAVAGALSELVEIVTEGLERTHRLVGDLRDFAAPEQDGDQEVDLVRGIESTVKLLGHMLRDHGIQVGFESDARVEAVKGNRRALNQVFLNLLKNAAEAIGDMGGNIEIVVTRIESEISVRIRDDGPGIAEEDLQFVFAPFFSGKSAGSGTGLGLSISQRIISEHGGAISVSSVEGTGTEFEVRLPVSGNAEE